MNKIIKQIFLPLMIALLIGSCNSDPDYYTLESPADQMHLKASKEDVTLERINETQEAISFSWDEATDRGDNAEIVYYFRLYNSEVKASDSELIKIDSETRSISFTTRELNNILASWKVTPGNKITVVGEVLAVAENTSVYMKPEISLVEFNVTGYEALNALYLTIQVGEQKQNLAMTKLDENTFHWKGNIEVSKFWFVRNASKGAPAYMKGADDSKLAYSLTGEGNPFNANRRGEYDITVNLKTLEITISTSFINTLYLVTSKGGTENIVKLYEYEVGSDIYHVDKRLEAGTKFRFSRESDVLWPAYVKGASDTKLELKGEGSEMFEITQTGLYNMVVNLNDLTISKQVVSPASSLYLITSLNGLESTPIQLTKVQSDRNVFYYKIKLDAGTEFRFVTNSSNKWPAYVKGADNSELVFRGTGTEMFKVATTATYVMSVNMEDMTMKFLDVYESSTGVIAVVGGVLPECRNPNGSWNAGKAIEFCTLTRKDLINNPEVISYTGTFEYTVGGTNENNAFKFVGDGNWGAGLFATGSYINPFDSANQSVSTSNTNDRKWMLPSGTASGTYTLSLNLHTMKIKLVKQ